MKVAILGSGNIGTDLLVKSLRSAHLEPTLFIGRNPNSPGMIRARELGVRTSADSIRALENEPKICDLVFDCTSALEHFKHAPILERLGIKVIDLTPAKLGPMCVPAVNMESCLEAMNVNMITCGGQASIPVAWVLGQTQKNIEWIEVVSSISARSAGPATRINLDEYIHTTEKGIQLFSGAMGTKTILNINPAKPCIHMQTTIFCKTPNPNLDRLKPELEKMVKKINAYVPGYEVIVGPAIENERIVVMVRVKGLGDYLPAYAGNLDIINCAAIAVAEEFSKKQAAELKGGKKDSTKELSV